MPEIGLAQRQLCGHEQAQGVVGVESRARIIGVIVGHGRGLEEILRLGRIGIGNARTVKIAWKIPFNERNNVAVQEDDCGSGIGIGHPGQFVN